MSVGWRAQHTLTHRHRQPATTATRARRTGVSSLFRLPLLLVCVHVRVLHISRRECVNTDRSRGHWTAKTRRQRVRVSHPLLVSRSLGRRVFFAFEDVVSGAAGCGQELQRWQRGRWPTALSSAAARAAISVGGILSITASAPIGRSNGRRRRRRRVCFIGGVLTAYQHCTQARGHVGQRRWIPASRQCEWWRRLRPARLGAFACAAPSPPRTAVATAQNSAPVVVVLGSERWRARPFHHRLLLAG